MTLLYFFWSNEWAKKGEFICLNFYGTENYIYIFFNYASTQLCN